MSYKEKHNGFGQGLVIVCDAGNDQFDYWASSPHTHHTDPAVSVKWHGEDEGAIGVSCVGSSARVEEAALGMAITALLKKGYNGYGIASKVSQRGFLRPVAAKKLRNVTIEIDGEVVVWGSQTKF